MDIANYISDLLGQQGELSVPNLGYFVQIRMPAYYDEAAKKFFPPHFSVQFDPQVIDDDDSLAAYITGLKKISIASAKYFIEKYIINLKSQAMIEDVPFAHLGVFSSDGMKLTFKPGTKTDTPAFFAFPPVDAYRIGEDTPAKAPGNRNESVPTTIITPEPAAPEPVTEPITAPEPEPEPYFTYTPPAPADVLPLNTEPEPTAVYTDEEVPRRSAGIWTIILIIVTILAVAFVALYKAKPELFTDWFSLHKNPYTASQPITPPVKHADSTVTDTSAMAPAGVTPANKDTVVTKPKKDSVKTNVKVPVSKALAAPPSVTASPAAAAAMPDSIAKGSWVIYGGAFPVRPSADKQVSNYQSMGYAQARLLTTNVKKGNNYKVILGAYKTKAEATDASKVMLMTHKINISVEQYK